MNKKSIKEYRVWRAMKARCYAPSQTKGNYKEYHIGVCERWKNSFSAFIEDMGMMPDETCRSGYSFERALEIPSDPKMVNAAIIEYYGL